MNEDMTSGVSLKPSDAQAGGGLFDDLDARITRCYFRLWDYNGTIPTPVLGLAVVYQRLDAEGGEFEQVYSGGDTKFLVPSPDGSEAIPVTKERTGLGDGSNAIQYLTSIVNSGFPEHLIGRKVTVFEGVEVHVNRVPQQKRPGIKPAVAAPGQPPKKDDILVVTKILNLEAIKAGTYQNSGAVAPAAAGKAAAPKGKAAAAGKAAPAMAGAAPVQAQAAAPAGVDADAVNTRAVEIVLQVLAEKGGSIAKAQIAGEAFKILNAAGDPLRNAVSQLVFKPEFLSNGPWSFDGTTISLG